MSMSSYQVHVPNVRTIAFIEPRGMKDYYAVFSCTTDLKHANDEMRLLEAVKKEMPVREIKFIGINGVRETKQVIFWEER